MFLAGERRSAAAEHEIANPCANEEVTELKTVVFHNVER
jgi:hypothetical protein